MYSRKLVPYSTTPDTTYQPTLKLSFPPSKESGAPDDVPNFKNIKASEVATTYKAIINFIIYLIVL